MESYIIVCVTVESADFKNGVNKLAALLKITTHPDHLVTLQAIGKVVTERLNAECLKNPDSVVPKVCHLLHFRVVVGRFPMKNDQFCFDLLNVESFSKIRILINTHFVSLFHSSINDVYYERQTMSPGSIPILLTCSTSTERILSRKCLNGNYNA